VRAVVDTNVFVSGLLNPQGPPGRIVDAILAGGIIVLYDDRTLAEYREVLARPAFDFESADVAALLDYLEAAGEAFSPLPSAAVLPDRDDLPFLETALAGEADALITGNPRHFKPVKGRHSVTILSPASAVDQLRR